jgi:integrase
LFRRDSDDDQSPRSSLTIESYYKTWITKQNDRVRPHRVKDFRSQFKCHLLPARIGRRLFGKIPLSLLRVTDLQELQAHLKAKGLKANSVNGVIGGSLRAMVKAARADGIVKVDLFDKALFSPLPLTDTQSSIDPYSRQERDAILEAFRTKRPHYYAFVFFRFWTGARPSETTALRWEDVDLRYSTARFNKGRVQGHERGTKNARSNREIHLHGHLVEVLKNHKPLHVKPRDYVFTTPAGTPIDEDNFYNREWLPTLRAKNVRPRPFYNTRHAYASFLVSIGAKSGFISAQTGDSIKTIETHYAKYEPDADTMRELVEERISQATKYLQSVFRGVSSPTPPENKKPPRNRGLKDGAGEEGRTPDLMLGKHTL